MPGRAGVPLDGDRAVHLAGDRAGGAAAGQVRLGRVQPVAAAGEHTGAEGRVQLVPGEGDPVDVQVTDGHAVVRGELGGVQDDPGAVPVGGGRELGDRPDLAGDVGGAGDAEQLGALAGAGQRLVQCGDRVGVRARGAQVVDGDALAAPGQQRGVVLGLEDEDPGAGRQRARQQVERVGGGAGEDHLVVVAQAEELLDGAAALLEQVGGELREVAGAAVHAAVVGGVGGDVVPDPLERRGAGGVVEGRVGDLLAADERDLDVVAEDGERGAGFGGDQRHGNALLWGKDPGSADLPVARACRADDVPRGPVLTQGTPPRTEGCRTASWGLSLSLMT